MKRPQFWIVIYLLVVASYTLLFWKIDTSTKVFLTSNELGDFLAGVFAPMAFIFLYLGYKQQGEAIKSNNQAILEQLKIQKSMLELQHRERSEREHSAQPIIDANFSIATAVFDTSVINISTGRLKESFMRKVRIKFNNSGAKVSQVNIKCINPFKKNLNFNEVLDESDSLYCDLSMKESTLEMYAETNRVNLDIQLSYVTSLGIRYKVNYEAEISSLLDDDFLTYSAVNTPVRITQYLE